MPGTSVVDRHRFDADPDPTFYFKADSDPDPDPDPTPNFTNGVKSEIVFTFIQISDSLNCFIFLVSVIGVKFSIFWTVFRNFLEKSISFTFG
jgi:hypothetical protein